MWVHLADEEPKELTHVCNCQHNTLESGIMLPRPDHPNDLSTKTAKFLFFAHKQAGMTIAIVCTYEWLVPKYAF